MVLGLEKVDEKSWMHIFESFGPIAPGKLHWTKRNERMRV